MLSVVQTNEIKENVSPLIVQIEDDELAKRFDLLMLTIELANLQSNNATKPIRKVVDTTEALLKPGTIPQVLAQSDIIEAVRTNKFLEQENIADLERVRVALRDLIRYIERSNQKVYYTNFQDKVMTIAENASMLNVNRRIHHSRKLKLRTSQIR